MITDKTKGIILMNLSTLFFAMMAAFVKAVPHISIAQKIFYRNIVALAFMIIYIVRKESTFKGKNFKLLMIRCVLGLTGVALYYYAIAKLPLADATLLNRMSPVFIIIMSIIFLGEKTNKAQIISMAIAILGAIFVIKPQFNYTILPALVGLLSAIFAAAAYVALRGLRLYTPPETIVFIFSLFSTIVTAPFMFIKYTQPSTMDWLVLIGIGICATIAQFAMTMSYRYAEATDTAVYGYGQIVFSTILGLLIWREIPDILSIIGGLLIIGSGILNYIDNNESRVSSEPKDLVE